MVMARDTHLPSGGQFRAIPDISSPEATLTGPSAGHSAQAPGSASWSRRALKCTNSNSGHSASLCRTPGRPLCMHGLDARSSLGLLGTRDWDVGSM